MIGEYSPPILVYLHLTDVLRCLSPPLHPPNSPTRNHIKENAAADTMRGLEMNQSLLFLRLVDSCTRICTCTRRPYSLLGEVSKKKYKKFKPLHFLVGLRADYTKVLLTLR